MEDVTTMGSILTLNIVNGTVVIIFCILSAGALGCLVVRRLRGSDLPATSRL